MFVHIDGVCQLQPIYHWRAVRPNCKWFTNNWINNCTHIDWSKQSAGVDVRYFQIKVFWAGPSLSVVVVVHFPGCCMDPPKKVFKGSSEVSTSCSMFSVNLIWKEWSGWWRGIFHFHMQLPRFMPVQDAMRKIPTSIWRRGEISREISFSECYSSYCFFSMWRHKEIFEDI